MVFRTGRESASDADAKPASEPGSCPNWITTPCMIRKESSDRAGGAERVLCYAEICFSFYRPVL